MAGFFDFVDGKLATDFNAKPYDNAKERQKHSRAMNKKIVAIKEGRKTRGLKVKNGVAEFTLPFAIQGQSVVYIPAERVIDALTRLIAEVNAGDHDADIKADMEGNAGETTETRQRAPRRDPAVIAAEKAEKEKRRAEKAQAKADKEAARLQS